MVDLAPAAKLWAAKHPQLVEVTTKLEEGGVHSAVFSSTLHHLVSLALGVPSMRRPADFDLLVPSSEFDEAAHLLGAHVTHKMVESVAGDGKTVRFEAQEAMAWVGSGVVRDEVQFMRPLTPVLVSGPGFEVGHDSRFKPQAVQARTIVETDYGWLPLDHLSGTIGMYGILQRDGQKNDAHNAATLLAAGDLLADPVTAARAADMQWDERVCNFILTAQEASRRIPVGVPALSVPELASV